MGVVIEMCIKYPGGRTWINDTYVSARVWRWRLAFGLGYVNNVTARTIGQIQRLILVLYNTGAIVIIDFLPGFISVLLKH